MMVQIENRTFAVSFEGPVCCRVKMATEKVTQDRKTKYAVVNVFFLITRTLLLNIVLRVSLTFVTQATANSFGLGGRSS